MKKCIFCDTPIKRTYYTCKDHLHFYKENKDAPWITELIQMDSKQERIDAKEIGVLYNDYYYAERMLHGKKLTKTDRIVSAFREGKNIEAIEKEFGYSKRMIYYALNSRGIRTPKTYKNKSSAN